MSQPEHPALVSFRPGVRSHDASIYPDQVPEPSTPEPTVEDLLREVADLRRGLLTRQVIGQATGLIAVRYSLNLVSAWELIAGVSQHANISVRHIARILTAAHDDVLTSVDQADANHIAQVLDLLTTKIAPPPDSVTKK